MNNKINKENNYKFLVKPIINNQHCEIFLKQLHYLLSPPLVRCRPPEPDILPKDKNVYYQWWLAKSNN